MSLSTDYPIGYKAYKENEHFRAIIDADVRLCRDKVAAKLRKQQMVARLQDLVYRGWRPPRTHADANEWIGLLYP